MNRPLEVLYVDDSPAMLDAFRADLAGGPFVVRTAASVIEAQRQITSHTFDIIVIDYHLGKITGDACLRELKRGTPAHTRYYLYTVDRDAFRQHRQMGFDGVLMLKGKVSVRTQLDALARSLDE